MKIPGVLWTSVAFVVVFAVGQFIDIDRIEEWVALALVIVNALLKAVELFRAAAPGVGGEPAARGMSDSYVGTMNTTNRGALSQWLLG